MKRNLWVSSALAMSLATIVAGVALADPPPANTVIGNQAAATFEADGQTFTVQSNLVETVVNEVYGVTLAASQTRSTAPGSVVLFPHAITNNGNTDDIFTLTTDLTGGTDDFTPTFQIFPDADEDGNADSLTPLSATPTILAGERFGVVVQASVPGTATNGQTADFVLTATSQADGTQTDANTDVINVSTGGIVSLQKDQILETDADGDGQISIGDTIEVTLTYSNTGIAAANNVIITDDLPVANTDGDAVTLTYGAGAAEWSDNPGTALTDAAGNVEFTNGQGTSLEYETTGATTVVATLDTLGAGRTGFITFQYVLTAAPEGAIENTALIESDTQAQTPSNVSSITIAPSSDVVLADAAATAPTPGGGVDGANLDGGDTSATDDDGAQDDVVTEDTDVFPGQDIVFDLVLTNLGNEADTFGLSAANTDFPAGTTFDFVAADGVTPIVGDEVALALGEVRHVRLIATLPASAPETAAPAGFDAVVTATSQKDASVSNTTAVLFNGAVQAQAVDLVNTDTVGGTTTGGVGPDVDNGGAAWTTLAVDPGDTAVFPLRITLPAGSPSNTFDLLASTDATFATVNTPAGWTVQFYKDGVPITTTGTLTPGTGADLEFDFEARVTPPASAVADATGVDFYFRAESPVNGLTDTKLDTVTINEVVDIAIDTDSSVQAVPGAAAIIPHTITNLGNSTVLGGAITLGGTDPFTDAGMSAAIFYDVNDDGVLDGGDVAITDLNQIVGTDATPGLSPGEQARVFVRVQAPSTLSVGVTETGDVTIDSALTTSVGAATDADTSNNAVVDTITTVSGDVDVLKEQALDQGCDATLDIGYSQTALDADPGDCVWYRLTAENVGTGTVTNVVISDVVPNYTTFEVCTANACAPTLNVDGTAGTVAVQPADEATGSVASSAPGAGFPLDPGSRAVLTFTVQIDE